VQPIEQETQLLSNIHLKLKFFRKFSDKHAELNKTSDFKWHAEVEAPVSRIGVNAHELLVTHVNKGSCQD